MENLGWFLLGICFGLVLGAAYTYWDVGMRLKRIIKELSQ
jgi:hypothetical protein